MHQIRVKFFGLLPKLDGLAGLLSALSLVDQIVFKFVAKRCDSKRQAPLYSGMIT